VAGTEDALGETRRTRRLSLPRFAVARRAFGGAAARDRDDMGARDALRRRFAARLRRVQARTLARRCALAALERAPAVAAGLAAAIPVLSSTVDAANAGWVPAGDDGIIATRGWDVLTSHTPLVGQYSEAGLVVHGQVLHSPGPLLYWLIALPAHFGSVTSIAVTMGIVNTLAIIGCVLLARRRGGLVLMLLTAIGIALMCQSLPSESFHDIWNPAAGLFPFLLLIFLGWSLACGDHRLLPLTALDASYVVQTHLMYVLPTAVLLGVGFCGLALGRLERRRRARDPHARAADAPSRRRRWIWPWALGALALTVVCWTAPIADQIEHDPGNLSTIVNTVEHRGSGIGTTVGWNAVVRSVGIRPWWLEVGKSEWSRKYDIGALPTRDGSFLHPSGGEVGSALAVLAGLAAVAMLGAFLLRWDLAAAAVIGLGLCGAIALEVAANPSTQLLAGTLGYTTWWGSQLGFFVWLVLAWALWLGAGVPLRAVRRALGARWRERGAAVPARARLTALAAASLCALGGVVAVGEAVAATGRPDSHQRQYQPVRRIAAGIARLVPPGQRVKLAVGSLGLGTQPMEPPIRFLLVRHGDRVLANGSFPRLGSYYEIYHRPVRWIVLLTDDARPRRHMKLAARVRFDTTWGHEVFSAWVRSTASAAISAGVPGRAGGTGQPRGGSGA
jgi:hypothetical protein